MGKVIAVGAFDDVASTDQQKEKEEEEEEEEEEEGVERAEWKEENAQNKVKISLVRLD